MTKTKVLNKFYQSDNFMVIFPNREIE